MIITSPANERYRLVEKLKKKKYRDRTGLFLIESRKLFEEALKSGIKVETLIVDEDNEEYPFEGEKVIFSKPLFRRASSMESPDGILAICKKWEKGPLGGEKILLLDHLQDPGNLGTLIRSGEAFGFFDILLYNDCVDFYNEKVLRASMGSIFRLNLVEVSREDLLDLKKTYKIYAADMGGVDFRKIDKTGKLILAIGNEGNGISDDLRELSDGLISIPMQGEVESLNAAIAGSILMNNFSL